MLRPVLIGMNNPLSDQDGHQLYPHPEGCTGHRLWMMLHERLPQVGRRQYLDTFERRNLVTGVHWSTPLGRQSAARMSAEFWGSGRTIVVLGEDVRRCFGLPKLLVEPLVVDGCTWRQLPHPSGRNLWYNDAKNRKLAGLLLEELYAAYHVDGSAGLVRAGGDEAGGSSG